MSLLCLLPTRSVLCLASYYKVLFPILLGMPQLSCKQCQSRKSKCNKQTPCSACQKAGTQCDVVQRARLPRGRSGKTKDKTAALEPRIARLEALVHQYNATGPDAHNTSSVEHADKRLETPQTGRLGGFVASDFWTVLSQEVAGLRETLEDSDDDQVDATASNVRSDNDGFSDGCSMLFASDQTHHTIQHTKPDARVRETLLDAYEARVNTVFKPLHWPIVCRGIRTRYGSTVISDASPSAKALEYAIYYMAVCSLSELECLDLFLDTKDKALHSYRNMTETLLTSARTLQNPDIQGLQAFVIYLQALRTCNGQALNWTLLAVAVRLATALGLGAKDPTSGPPIMLDARRRLWFSICLMDTQATLDRGAAPLIHAKDLGTPPRDLNDNELESAITFSPRSTALTDMSFSMMTYEAMVCFKRICALDEVPDDGWRRWEQKLELVAELESVFSSKYFPIDPVDATPIEMMRQGGARSIAASMRLLLRRPPYRSRYHAVPPTDEFDSMASATEVLRRHMDLDARQLAPWAWKKWTPWYALAVALAELCRNPYGDGADEAYPVVREAFRRYSAPVTDIDQGMLWRPIARLFRHVTKLKGQLTSTISVASQAPREPDYCDPPSSVDHCFQKEQTASSSRSEPASRAAGGSQAVADLDGWSVNADLLRLPPDPVTGLVNTSDLDMLDLDFDQGVSWLDWDLILQDVDDA